MIYKVFKQKVVWGLFALTAIMLGQVGSASATTYYSTTAVSTPYTPAMCQDGGTVFNNKRYYKGATFYPYDTMYGDTSYRWALTTSQGSFVGVYNPYGSFAIQGGAGSQFIFKSNSKPLNVNAVLAAANDAGTLVNGPTPPNATTLGMQLVYHINRRAITNGSNSTVLGEYYPMIGSTIGAYTTFNITNWAFYGTRQAGYECANYYVSRCGDGVKDDGGSVPVGTALTDGFGYNIWNGTSNTINGGEQCDLGANNGQPGSLCSATCQNITPPATPDVWVTKAVATSGTNLPSGYVEYTLNYGNLGPGIASGVVVTDTLPAEVTFVSVVSSTPTVGTPSITLVGGRQVLTWTVGNLASGATGTIRIKVQIKATTPICTNLVVTNDLSIAAVNEPKTVLRNNQDDASFTMGCIQTPPPDLSIVKSVQGSTTGYTSGNIVTYQLLIRNLGTGSATGVTVSDQLPANVTYVSGSSSGSPIATSAPTIAPGNVLQWNIGTMPAGYVTTITFQVTLGANIAMCTQHTNIATIATTNNPVDTYLRNNTSFAMITTECPTPDVYVQKSASAVSGSYLPGQDIEYTIVYGNQGQGIATGVVVSDTLPINVTYVGVISTTPTLPAPSQTTIAGQQILTWTVGTLNPGQTGTIKIKVKINAQVPMCSGVTINNQAIIAANGEPATLLVNNQDDALIAIGCVDLWSQKTVNKSVVQSGEIITYTITYGNSGTVARPGSVKDTLPAGFTFDAMVSSVPAVGSPIIGTSGSLQTLTWNVGTLLPGANGTITFSVKVGGVQKNTQYTNYVCISDDNNYNNNNCDNVPVTGDEPALLFDLSIDKTPKMKTVTLHEEFDYTLTISNNGQTGVNNFSVRDYLPVGLDYVSAIAPAGSTVSYNVSTRTVTWNGLDIGAVGTLTLTVRVKYVGPVSLGMRTNWAEICTYNGIGSGSGQNTNNPYDVDSNPCNGTGNNEDDVSSGSVVPVVDPLYFDLSINKTPKSQVAYSGQNISFTLTVANNGNTGVNNFSVKDYLPEGLDYVSSSPAGIYDATTRTVTRNGLDIGATGSLQVTIVATYRTNTKVTNWTEICTYNGVGSGSGQNPTSPNDIDSNPCNGTGNNEDDVSSGDVTPLYIDLNVNKLVNGVKTVKVSSGEIVDFTLVVGNSGNATATGFSVKDYLPHGFTFIQSSPIAFSVTTGSNGTTIVWNGLTLAAGQTMTISFKAKYHDTVARTNYTEICTYNGQNGNDSGVTPAPQDGDSTPCNGTGNNEDDTSNAGVVPQNDFYDLSLNKLINGAKSVILTTKPQTVTVSLVVANSGTVGVNDFSIKDYMPAGLEYVAGSSNIPGTTYDSVGRVVTFPGLNIGASGSVTITFQAIYSDTTTRINYAEICTYNGVSYTGADAKDIDSNPCNRGATPPVEDDESSAQISYEPGGGGDKPTMDVELNKLVNGVKSVTVARGSTVTFTLVVKNIGNTSLPNKVTVRDYLPEGVDYIADTATTGAGVSVVYNPTTRQLIRSGVQLNAMTEVKLEFKAVFNGADKRINYAEVCDYNGKTDNKSGQATSPINPTDVDSDPCNMAGQNTPKEDDESSAEISPSSGGGCTNCGGSNPYCGDRARQQNEVCDEGVEGGIIPTGKPYAGRWCYGTNSKYACTVRSFGTGTTIPPTCAYIDPPSIQKNEYLPYWWDIEGKNGENLNYVNTCTKAGDVIKNSMRCTFTIMDYNGVEKVLPNEPCITSNTSRLVSSAYTQTLKSLGYTSSEFAMPAGFGAVQVPFTSLGEHIITIKVDKYSVCDVPTTGGVFTTTTYNTNKDERVCQMNFVVTDPYMVSRGAMGDFASQSLTDFREFPYGTQLFPSGLPAMNTNLDSTAEVKTAVQKLIDTYKPLAVSAGETKIQSNATVGVTVKISKVPSKEIYFFEASDADANITISDRVGQANNKPFTIIVTKGNLVIADDLVNSPRGMYIVANGGDIIIKPGVSCQLGQKITGIFISQSGIVSSGTPFGTNGRATMQNTDLSYDWCSGGDLTIQGVLIGNGATNMTNVRRSSVNDWFTTSNRKESILNNGAIVLKYNPDIFNNLPPGAEVLSQVLNVYKR